MKLMRPFVLAMVLAGAFFYFTTYRSGRPALTNWIGRPNKVEISEASSASEPLDSEEQNNITVYRKNIGSVVNVTSRTMAFDFFYGLVPEEGQGSGFVIDRDGHILTNYHVIASSRQGARIDVTLHNRKKYRASIVGTDAAHDLAVIQIKAPDLQPMTLGDSTHLLVGQKVYAIGNPFGLAGTLTRGIVSSIRSVEEPDGVRIEEAIQTDAAINPGNSGGPLLNWHGEVIGINTMIASQVGQSSGIGFAIPVNTAKAVLNDLVTLGRVRRPALGVRTLPIDPDLADQMGLAADYGLLIVQVIPGGAADRAGLRAGSERAYLGNMPISVGGDLIVTIDGEQVQDQPDLQQMMDRHRAGDTVRITIYRGKKKMDVNVTLG
ncbi:MAG TPA: trypsin-like peptidase domain-containing protein, partial [Terriglobales bacterium]|nr:trypsin-like peptidase domain-containing protein [Terriglobales bacterium]